MKKILHKILKISRPRFWTYLFGPFLLAYTFGDLSFHPFTTIQFWYSLLYFIIPANIFVYAVNDLYDQETDALNPKKEDKERRMKDSEVSFYKRLILASFALSLPLFFFLDSTPRIMLIVFFLLSFFYSAPPLRFKERPFVDSLSNILYAMPGFIFYTQLTGNLPSIEILIAAWAWTAAMHLYSAIPDIEADEAVGLQTTAVFLGREKSLVLCALLWGVTAQIVTRIDPMLSVAFLYPLLIIGVIMRQIHIEKLYWAFPWIHWVLGFILFWYAIIR